jgi:integrase
MTRWLDGILVGLMGCWSGAGGRVKNEVGDAVPADLHFHDLRHSGNYFAASSGASTRELIGRLGHASMRVALLYQHRTMTRDRAIAEALDALIAQRQS